MMIAPQSYDDSIIGLSSYSAKCGGMMPAAVRIREAAEVDN